MSMHLLNQDSTEQINLWRFDVIETIWSQEWRLNAKTLSRHVYVQKHWKHNNVTVKSKTAQSGINNLLLCTRFNSTTRTKQHAGLYKYPNIKKTCALCQQCFDAFAAVLVAQDSVPILENGSGRVAVVFTCRFVGQETVKLLLWDVCVLLFLLFFLFYFHSLVKHRD